MLLSIPATFCFFNMECILAYIVLLCYVLSCFFCICQNVWFYAHILLYYLHPYIYILLCVMLSDNKYAFYLGLCHVPYIKSCTLPPLFYMWWLYYICCKLSFVSSEHMMFHGARGSIIFFFFLWWYWIWLTNLATFHSLYKLLCITCRMVFSLYVR